MLVTRIAMAFPGRPPLPPPLNNNAFFGSTNSDNTSTYSSSATIPLTHGYEPADTDILCGRRGNVNSKHAGNKVFTKRVRDSLKEYINGSSRINRTLVVASVVDSLRCDGMRFIKFDETLNRYVELSNDQTHAKVGHAIRDQIKHNGIAQLKPLPSSRKSRSSSLPDPRPAPDDVGSKTITAQAKKLQRRHSDTLAPSKNEVAAIRDTKEEQIEKGENIPGDDDQRQMFGSTSYYGSLMDHQQPQGLNSSTTVEDKKPSLHQAASATTANEDNFQFLREQRVGRSDISRMFFDLGQNRGVHQQGILSNDLAAPTPEQALSSSLLASLRQQVNEQPAGRPFLTGKLENGTGAGSGGIAKPTPTSSSACSPSFAPLSLDSSETNFEEHDIDELSDILDGNFEEEHDIDELSDIFDGR